MKLRVILIVPMLMLTAIQSMAQQQGHAVISQDDVNIIDGYKDNLGHILLINYSGARSLWGDKHTLYHLSASMNGYQFGNGEFGRTPNFFDPRALYDASRNVISRDNQVYGKSADGINFTFECKNQKFEYAPLSAVEIERIKQKILSGESIVAPAEKLHQIKTPLLLYREYDGTYYYVDYDSSSRRLLRGKTPADIKEVEIKSFEHKSLLCPSPYLIETADGDKISIKPRGCSGNTADAFKVEHAADGFKSHPLEKINITSFDFSKIGISFDDLRYRSSELHTPCNPALIQ